MPVREPPYRREWRQQTQEGYGPGPYLQYQRRPPGPKPVATYWLLGAILGTFILQLAVLGFGGEKLHRTLFVVGIDWYLRPWSPLTSTVAHTGLSHLFFNGLFLYFLGPTIEALVGRARFLVVFFATGAIAGIFQAHLGAAVAGNTDPSVGGALGASGALMALFGILLVIAPKSKMIVFPIPVPIPLWAAGLVFILLDLVGAFNPGNRVGNFAHLAGLALGAAYGWYVKLELERRGRLAHGV